MRLWFFLLDYLRLLMLCFSDLFLLFVLCRLFSLYFSISIHNDVLTWPDVAIIICCPSSSLVTFFFLLFIHFLFLLVLFLQLFDSRHFLLAFLLLFPFFLFAAFVELLQLFDQLQVQLSSFQVFIVGINNFNQQVFYVNGLLNCWGFLNVDFFVKLVVRHCQQFWQWRLLKLLRCCYRLSSVWTYEMVQFPQTFTQSWVKVVLHIIVSTTLQLTWYHCPFVTVLSL